jgi:hypothetical protein
MADRQWQDLPNATTAEKAVTDFQPDHAGDDAGWCKFAKPAQRIALEIAAHNVAHAIFFGSREAPHS